MERQSRQWIQAVDNQQFTDRGDDGRGGARTVQHAGDVISKVKYVLSATEGEVAKSVQLVHLAPHLQKQA